jgi:hypothetical protein
MSPFRDRTWNAGNRRYDDIRHLTVHDTVQGHKIWQSKGLTLTLHNYWAVCRYFTHILSCCVFVSDLTLIIYFSQFSFPSLYFFIAFYCSIPHMRMSCSTSSVSCLQEKCYFSDDLYETVALNIQVFWDSTPYLTFHARLLPQSSR